MFRLNSVNFAGSPVRHRQRRYFFSWMPWTLLFVRLNAVNAAFFLLNAVKRLVFQLNAVNAASFTVKGREHNFFLFQRPYRRYFSS